MKLTITPLEVLALRQWLEGRGEEEKMTEDIQAARAGLIPQSDWDDAEWGALAQKRRMFTDDLELDEDVKVSVAEDGSGAWVRAWVWVENPAYDPHAPAKKQRQAVKDSLRGMEGQ